MSCWLKKKHKNDIASLEMLLCCDDCKLIKKIGNWEIDLTPDNNFIEENSYPDWYGYQKIDGIQRSNNFIYKKILLITYMNINVLKFLKRT